MIDIMLAEPVDRKHLGRVNDERMLLVYLCILQLTKRTLYYVQDIFFLTIR